jgi:microcystin-dependent protein
VLIMQQLNADLALRALTYVINSYIPNVNSTNLPLLTNQNNQIWISQGGVVVAAELVQNPNVSVLQALLASQVDNADGASLIGYYDQTNNVPQTLAHFLNNLSSYISTVVAGLIPASGFSTGDIKKTLNPTPAAGWILWTNGTIGSAASGASVYANAAASALYTLLWNTYSNTICPVSGGRGANAGADFGANKTLALPNVDYSVLVNQANVASIGAYVPGQNFGEATHLLTTAELPSQTYSASGVAASRLPNLSGPSGVTLAATTNGTPQAGIGIAVAVSDANGGGAHNNIQPSTAVYFVVKL